MGDGWVCEPCRCRRKIVLSRMPFRAPKLIAKSVILFLAGALASTAHSQPIQWTKMIWEAANLGPRTEPHAGLLLDVKLDSQPAPARNWIQAQAAISYT